MTTRIGTIFGQEFRQVRRNLWVVLATGILGLFALALALFGAGQGAALKADVLTITSASLATLSVYLIPLIALLMSYDSLAGEIERGTLALTFATPARRWEVFLGKFLAQATAVGLAIVLAFGVAGLTAGLSLGTGVEGIAAWLRLMATAAALGAVFVGVGLMLSALTGRTARAAAATVGTWLLLVVLYDVALLGALMASGESTFATHVFPWLVIANPADAFRLYNLTLIETAPIAGIDGLARTLPFPPVAALAGHGLWLATCLTLGVIRTRRIVP
ncbi:ABC transporter permease [Salipiger mucosus]|uniref:Nitrous oxide reductase maturation transmembrane protein NosY n=1 Tax=Salipiger mucosus DSM 16094 TaxID=1123237 RepID=S9QEC3_9RHOB|nr:ABC transporter permease subunit [Salipiger mucosus]EPX77933.1 Nitrous oxide reductase maturation transmembrane protein NosY [Salipiger mucosus DSM 16094]